MIPSNSFWILCISTTNNLKKIVYSGKIQLISPTQIRWILKDDEGVYTSDEKWVESGFSVPTDVIMTKKEQLLVR